MLDIAKSAHNLYQTDIKNMTPLTFSDQPREQGDF
jgi:hypothetical protein